MILLNNLFAWFKLPERTIKALFHTFWHLLGTLLPLLIVYILSIIFCRLDQINHFIDDGDFCLFSAAILTPASYILSQFSRDEKRKMIRRWPSFYYAVSVTVILITAMLFASVYIKNIFPNIDMNYQIFETLSITFLVLSVIIFFLAQKIQIKYEEGAPSMKNEELKEINNMDKGFDDLP